MPRLNELLALSRPLIIFDLETTGVDDDARIVELGFQLWDASGLRKEWRSLVNPGMPIPAETTAIHGYDDARMLRCSRCNTGHEAGSATDCTEFKLIPHFEHIAPNIAQGFSNCDFGGKNIRFDLKKLAANMARVRVVWSYVGARIIDAERFEQIGEPRTLSALYRKHTGKEPLNAHAALSDVQMTTEILEAQLAAYSVLPRDLDELHRLQWPGWIDGEGKFRFEKGVPTCTFGKWARRPMRSIPPDYWGFMLRSDFSPEIKALATAALKGEYPVEKR